MAVTTRRWLRGPRRYAWAFMVVMVVIAAATVAAVLVNAAHQAAQTLQVTVRAETVGGALPVLQGHQVAAELTDYALTTTPTPSTATVSSLDASVVAVSMAGGASWWNVDPSVKKADQEKVHSTEGDGVLVITDWQTYIADSDAGQGGSTAALAGWRVEWGQAAPGEYVIETSLRWVPASSKTGKIDGPVPVRVHITVAKQR